MLHETKYVKDGFNCSIKEHLRSIKNQEEKK